MNKNNLNNIDALIGAIEMPLVSVDTQMAFTSELYCGITISMMLCA